MGIRGPLPEKAVVPAEPLQDLTAPAWLPQLAKSFWTRHAKWLADNHLLTTATADSFALISSLWARYVSDPEHSGSQATVNQFKSLAKLFHLLPDAKSGKPVKSRADLFPSLDDEEF